MSNFDQHRQKVGTQYNAEQITINMGSSAPAPRPALLWHVPYERNPFFTGREDTLHLLHEALTTTQNAALTQAISGLGGIGKTQTALEYVYRYHREYQAIFWIRASSREELLADLMQLAHVLPLPQQQDQDQQSLLLAVKQWFQSNINWLLIVDNADDLNLVKEYLPTHTAGHLLLTTRSQAVRSLARKVELTTLPLEESILFLLKRAGFLGQDEASLQQVAATTRATAEAIAKALGSLPLALDQAAAYVEETETSLTDYLNLYQHERKALLARRGGLGENHAPVATTWSLAFHQLATSNPAAIDLMRLCAFLAPDAIAEEMLLQGAYHVSAVVQQAASTPLAWNHVIEDLGRYSLLHRQSETQTLSLHRLVQSVLSDEMDVLTREHWTHVALRVVEDAFPFNEVAPWRQSQRYVLDALTSLEHADQFQVEPVEAISLRFKVASYFHDRGQYVSAQALYEQVLRSREQQLGAEHPDTLSTRHALATLYAVQGKYEPAQVLYEQVLRSQEQQLGAEHPDTLGTRHNLAILYKNQGKYEPAQALYEQVLHSQEQQLGAEHPDTLRTRHNLANLYADQGKYEPAQALYEQVLRSREQQLGAEHPDTLSTRHNLATLYQNQGKYEPAQALYEQVLRSREQQLGAEHPDTLSTRHNLATLYKDQGKKATTLLSRIRNWLKV
jgi:tetratricopeptide (TPR) repeat protein